LSVAELVGDGVGLTACGAEMTTRAGREPMDGTMVQIMHDNLPEDDEHVARQSRGPQSGQWSTSCPHTVDGRSWVLADRLTSNLEPQKMQRGFLGVDRRREPAGVSFIQTLEEVCMGRRICVMLVLTALVASAGFAATTGRMTGTVKDNDGLALPGVTVQISSDRLIGGPQIAITDGNGAFVFNLLAPGTYSVEATLAGFQPASGEVRVQLDRVAAIAFSMVPEQFGGEIEVVATVPVVDTTQVNTSVVFDEDYLQNAAIGAGGRDYLQIIGTAAGVAGTGNASVYGGTEGDNSFLVDGLNTTDPLLGTFGTNFNYDAIQEINFQTGGFEAEFGQATGGIINLVTKSGGNEFTGSFDARYRDETFTEEGDHFSRDAQSSLFKNFSGTLGGPIVRDRVWFFASYEKVNTEGQAANAQFVREFDGQNYIGKLTWQATDSHRAVFKYSGDPAKIPGANSAYYVEPSASRTQEQGGDIWQAELNSVLSETVLLNAQVGIVRGYLDSFPTSGTDLTSWHEDEGDLVERNSTQFSSFDTRDRDEYRFNMTWFVDEFAGSHEFKAGVEYNDLMYSGIGYINGHGYFNDAPFQEGFNDLNGDGYLNHYVTIKEPGLGDRPSIDNPEFIAQVRAPVDSDGSISTAFVQDAWRPISNLTIKPGVRFDNTKFTNSIGEDVADMDRIQPRFGFAWDLFGDSRHVVRGSWGRFMDATALSIPNFATGVTEIYHEYNTLEYYCDSVGFCTTDRLPASWDWFNWTSGEGNEYVLIDNRGAAQIYEPAKTLDQAGAGSLQAPYADELIVAYETQIAPETSIELTYIDKKTKEIIEDTCSNNTWIWTDDPRPSLDDPSTWTDGAGCNFYMITNHSDFYREYKGYVLKFETRKDWMHLIMSWTHSDSKGNTANGARESYATALADSYPVDFFNQDGYMPDHRKDRVKVNGYFLLPWDVTLGFDGFYSSPGRMTVSSTCDAYGAATNNQALLDFYGVRGDLAQYCSNVGGGSTIFLEPRGSRKNKSVWQLDLQLSKTFKVGSVDLTGIVTVQNVTGHEFDSTFNSTAFRTTSDPSFGQHVDGTPEDVYYVPIGQPTSYWLPRRYEVGFRIEF
jgi:hypothetical protein